MACTAYSAASGGHCQPGRRDARRGLRPGLRTDTMLPMATATRTDQTHPLAEVLRHGPFHVALRAAIDARGLGLDRLQHRLAERGLRVSTTSLSYWQHGRTQPEKPNSIAAVGVLEEILGVPANALVSLLGPRRARGPRTIRSEER